MKFSEITLKNIASFAEGNAKYYYDRMVGMAPFMQEQVAYRLSKCKDDCLVRGKCVYCGCPPSKKAWVVDSCNKGERFGKLLDKERWEKFKQDNPDWNQNIPS